MGLPLPNFNLTLAQVRENRLCRDPARRNDGVMECWNDGFSGIEILFYWGGTDQKLKSDHHPILIPNIPLFHHSIIPPDI